MVSDLLTKLPQTFVLLSVCMENGQVLPWPLGEECHREDQMSTGSLSGLMNDQDFHHKDSLRGVGIVLTLSSGTHTDKNVLK